MLRRAKHNLSEYTLTAFDMGQLIPIGVKEVLPGDTFRMSSNMMLRLSPLVTPVMHPVEMVIHHWYVPDRVVWSDFEKWITGGLNGLDASVYPTISAPAGTGWAVGSLGDYFRLPVGEDNLSVSALPWRKYALICNHYYLDEQLDAQLPISYASGPDVTTSTALQNVRWGKDYFTKARPEPQLGPDVYLPIATSAPVIGNGKAMRFTDGTSTSGAGLSAAGAVISTTGNVGQNVGVTNVGSPYAPNKVMNFPADGSSQVLVDLSQAAGVTINQLRQSSAFQRFFERMNRAGARYDEYLLSMGVRSSDGRLQLPEYLGGSTQTIQFSEVLGTTQENLGELGGHGIGAMRSNSFTRFFEEHGHIISVAYVRPKTMYTQGVHRMWSRRTKWDIFQPELQHIGDQEIYNREIYAQGTTADAQVFGYTPRYDEYRQGVSGVSGEMRTVLDSWHMARIFSSAPALNSDFVKSNPTDRIFAASTNQTLYAYIKHNCVAQRLVAKRGTSFLS